MDATATPAALKAAHRSVNKVIEVLDKPPKRVTYKNWGKTYYIFKHHDHEQYYACSIGLLFAAQNPQTKWNDSRHLENWLITSKDMKEINNIWVEHRGIYANLHVMLNYWTDIQCLPAEQIIVKLQQVLTHMKPGHKDRWIAKY